LLLVVGELDPNVDPASAYQVADALIKADKDFELLVLTGQGHTPGGSYGERRRFDFFVRHLMDQAPPRRNGNVLTSRAPAETAKALGEE
jgi:dipeptidyl aminopeptidase/acylaminoacyl peptidase